MNSQEAIKQLGVTPETLSKAERETLDREGYLVMPGVLSNDEVNELRRRLDLLAELEGDDAGNEVHQEAGTARLSNLVDKGRAFQIAFTHPKVLAGIAHVLEGDLKLSSLNSRTALPGKGLQALHADWGKAVEPGNYQVCNSIWLLDDFTPENGATRVVAGSHRSGKMPQDVMADPTAAHPDEKLLLAPAGTVVVFNSHTWHGGTLNRTGASRHAMHAYYTRSHQPQQLNQRRYLSAAMVESLSPEARCLLDVE